MTRPNSVFRARHGETDARVNLRGERKLTVEHVKKLAAEFHLNAGYFIA